MPDVLSDKSAPKKTWLRWNQLSKTFPTDKYGFSKHLKKVGDYILTHPMEYADMYRMFIAVKNWAYYHKKRVSTERFPVADGKYRLKVMLTSQHRKREFDF